MASGIGGGKMNKEQAKIEYRKIIADCIKQEDKIMQEAKKSGTWKMGLDSNNELFADLHKKTKEKIDLLKSLIDE